MRLLLSLVNVSFIFLIFLSFFLFSSSDFIQFIFFFLDMGITILIDLYVQYIVHPNRYWKISKLLKDI